MKVGNGLEPDFTGLLANPRRVMAIQARSQDAERARRPAADRRSSRWQQGLFLRTDRG